MAPKILLVEDDPVLSSEVDHHLTGEGYSVTPLSDGAEGLAAAMSDDFDLLVIDIGLPSLNGAEVCRRLRASGKHLPIIMLTGRGAETDRVLGLELGADDYVAKPCSLAELAARVRALLRRGEWSARAGERSETFEIGALLFDFDRMIVSRESRRLDITATEFRLLSFLVKNRGKPFSRDHLLEEVWGYGAVGYEHTVNTHINRIRIKIEADPATPRYLLTVRGVGYRFAEPHEV